VSIEAPPPNKRLQRTRHERASLVSCVGEPLKRNVRRLRVQSKMDQSNDTMLKHLRSLLTSEEPSLQREDEWALSRFMTNLVGARSKSRSHGFADGLNYYELRRPAIGEVKIYGLMHWTDSKGGWIDPFLARLWLDPLVPTGVGFHIYFGMSENPTIVLGKSAHRKLQNEIRCSSSDLTEGDNWSFEFRSDQPETTPN
jgi:hypothetical protein